jgi:hypothetical protein
MWDDDQQKKCQSYSKCYLDHKNAGRSMDCKYCQSQPIDFDLVTFDLDKKHNVWDDLDEMKRRDRAGTRQSAEPPDYKDYDNPIDWLIHSNS